MTQINLFDQDECDEVILSDETIKLLEEKIVPFCKESSDFTLQMGYLDPDHTNSQMVGTYLYGNLTSRLYGEFGGEVNTSLKAVWQNQRFLLIVELPDGKKLSLPVHKTRLNHVPAGAQALKRRLRALQHQCSLIDEFPPGLFIGLLYDEVKGLLEVFLAKLSWNGIKRQYSSKALSVLYSRPVGIVKAESLPDHEYEQVKDPEVKLKRNGE